MRFARGWACSRVTDRALRALIVASCLALQLSGTIHLAVVQHAICAEHGEAMDVHDGHTDAAEPKSAAAPDGIHAGGEGSPVEDAHHHCPLDEDRSTHALVVHAAGLAPRVELPAPALRPSTDGASITPRARQLLAPKTSPPV